MSSCYHLSFLRGEFSNPGGKAGVGRSVNWLVLRSRGSGERAQIVSVSPVARGADRAWGETAAAIWADIADHLCDAGCAESAFERANARLQRVRRERLVAVLAGRAQCQRDDRVEFFVAEIVFPPDLFF